MIIILMIVAKKVEWYYMWNSTLFDLLPPPILLQYLCYNRSIKRNGKPKGIRGTEGAKNRKKKEMKRTW